MKTQACLWLMVLCCACGSTNKAATTGGDTKVSLDTNVTVSGTLKPFPFVPSLDANDLVHLSITLADPAVISANPNAKPTWLGVVSLDPTKCTDTGCSFTIPHVDTSKLTIGMVVGAVDNREAVDPNTATLASMFTGVPPASITAAATTGNLNNVIAFTMSKAGFGALAVTTTAPTTLVSHGVILGLVLGADDATPVPNATLTTPDYAGTVWYPGIDPTTHLVTTASTTGGTSASGLIVASPTAAVSTLSTGWKLSASGSPLKWTLPTLGSAPGVILVAPFVPDP